MGFIADLSKRKAFPGQGNDRALWRQIFQSTTKEDGSRLPKVRPTPGGSWGRSGIASPESYKRLLQAMRSMAPGGWSDDRWEQTKHLVSIAYIAIHRIASQWGQSTFGVFRKDPNHPDGKVPVSEADPGEMNEYGATGWDLVKLLERPNNQDSWGKFLYRMAQQKYLTGTILDWLVPNKLGRPYEMYVIPTAIAIPQPAINPDYPDGYYRIQPIYPYGPFSSYPTPASAVGAPIPAQWMLRFQFPHPFLRYDGYSPLTGLRLEMDQVEQMGRSRWYTLKRLINPSAVLNFEAEEGMQQLPWEEIERIKAEFENELQGAENSGKLFVSVNGKIEPWANNLRDLQYTEGWEQMISFVLAGFGISKAAAGMSDDASYANLWASLKQLHELTLKPDVEDVAADFTHHLAPYFGDDLVVEIKCPRIDDHDMLMTRIDKAISAKAITKNQVLKMLDMPITHEPWGEDIAGDPSEAEKEQQEQQQAGMPGPGGAPGEGAGPAMPPESMPPGGPEKEIKKGQPVPGKVSEGGLGPRKELVAGFVGRKSLSMYERVRRATKNGVLLGK